MKINDLDVEVKLVKVKIVDKKTGEVKFIDLEEE